MFRYAILVVVLSLPIICRVQAQCRAEKVSASYHQASKSYGDADYFLLSNELNRYMVYYQRIRISAERDGGCLVGIPQPVFWNNFISRDFSTLTINNIRSNQLEPKEFILFGDENLAGVEAIYNFDGVRMLLRFSVQTGSPLLFMEWLWDEERSLEKIKSAKLQLTTYPSYNVPNGGKFDDSYQREIKTAARTITSPERTAWVSLQNDDQFLMMYDRHYQGGTLLDLKHPPQGPCYLRLNWQNIKSARVWFGKIYCMNFEFQLQLQGRTLWRAGLFEIKKRMSNAEFFNYYQDNISGFQLPATGDK